MAIFSTIAGAIAQGGAQAGGDMAWGAASQAAADSRHQRNVARADASPYTSTGRRAVDEIGRLLGWGYLGGQGGEEGIYDWDLNGQNDETKKVTRDNAFKLFKASPDYNFRLDEGGKALDRSAASRGLLRSGAQQKAITDFGQQMASQEYGNYLGNLMKLAGMGGEATAANNSNATALTASAGNMLTQGGAARGSAYSQGANAFASGIGAGANNLIGGAYMFGGFGKPKGPSSFGGTLAISGS